MDGNINGPLPETLVVTIAVDPASGNMAYPHGEQLGALRTHGYAEDHPDRWTGSRAALSAQPAGRKCGYRGAGGNPAGEAEVTRGGLESTGEYRECAGVNLMEGK